MASRTCFVVFLNRIGLAQAHQVFRTFLIAALETVNGRCSIKITFPLVFPEPLQDHVQVMGFVNEKELQPKP